MARFRNTLNGVVVDVDEGTAERLGSAYEPVEAAAPAKASPRKRATKTDDD